MIKEKRKSLEIIEIIKEMIRIGPINIIRMEYEMRLKAKRDRKAQDDYVYAQGMVEGYAEYVVPILRRQGMTDDEIVDSVMEKLGFSKYDLLKYWFKESLQEDSINMEEDLNLDREEGFINALRRAKYTDEQIANELMEEYGLSREEALEKLK